MDIETYKKATDLLNERDFCITKRIGINTAMNKLKSLDECAVVVSDVRLLFPTELVEPMLKCAMDYYTEEMHKVEKEFEEL